MPFSKAMKKFTFKVKEGVYCSWCVDMMRKILFKRFSIKRLEADIIESRISMFVPAGVGKKNIMNYLDLRGYHLRDLKNNAEGKEGA